MEQENDPKPFMEEEIVEPRIPKLGFRLMGKATREVVRPGGIIASAVGFGKTAVTLGLVYHQKETNRKWAAEQQKNSLWLIPTKATLVLVPHHLVDQWFDEAHRFLPGEPSILWIKDIRQVKSKTIYEIQHSDVIVMNWNTCFGENYIFELAQVAGMIGPDENASPRAKTSCTRRPCRKLRRT
jgi:hypothetical protein